MEGKPKICMIVQQPDVKGGIAAVTSGYYGSLLEDTFDITYVESYCDKGVIPMLIKAFRGLLEFKKVISSQDIQLVHMHTSFGGSFYRMQPFMNLAIRRGIPVLDHLHGADFDSFFVNASSGKKKRIREVYERFSKIIVLSDEWKEKMSQIVPSDKLVVLENYCKPKDKAFVEALYEKRFCNKQVLFLGELGKRKGGYDFAGIIKRVLEKEPEAKFMLCGDGDESDVAQIKSDVCKVCSKEKALFPGWVRDSAKDAVLKESAVFLLPSYNEGLPMAVLDAMAYGLPVVSTNVGGIPQLVDNGSSGYIAEPGDCDALAEGICRLLSDKERYHVASNKSLEIATDKYGFEAHARRLAGIYNSLIG